MTKEEGTSMPGHISIFTDQNEPEWLHVQQIAIERFFAKRTRVFTEGSDKEAVFFIREGMVKTYKIDENGNECIISFLKPGDMFPHIGLFNRDPYPATAEAMVDSRLYAIPIGRFEQLLLNTPAIAIKVLRVLDMKIKELQEKLRQFTGQDVNRRALSFLLNLAEHYGRQQGNALLIELPLTNQELASAVGTTRETINRLLNQLRKENILKTSRSRIAILDLQRLQQWRTRS